ncbi:MAG: zinc-binding dehydrogenase [Armatimonadota bacterium]
MRIPETMWALRLHGTGMDSLVLEEIATPRPGPGQLLARVEACNACASDNKIIDQGGEHALMFGWDLGRYPTVVGHEGCVTVVETGAGLADTYRVGGRYAVQPAIPAGPRHHRDRYRGGAQGVEKVAIGYTLDGLFSEYVLITEEVLETGCLLPLPDAGMPHFAAALAEPLSCVVSAQQHSLHILKDSPASPRRAHLGLKPGGVVAVLGAGPMGQLHVEVALRYRPRVVIVSDPLPGRIAKVRADIAGKAERAGTRLVLTTPEQFEEVLGQESGGRGADDIIVALGIRQVQERAFELLARGGVVNLFGGLKLGDHMLTLDSRRIHYDSVMAVGSSGGDPSDVAEALSLLADGTVEAANYVAAVGGLDAAKHLIEMVRGQRLEGKGVIYPHARGPLETVDRWSAASEREYLQAHGR